MLQAKLTLLELDISSARQLLTQAQILAEDKGLHRLAQRISSEHDVLLAQLPQWEALPTQDAPLAEVRELAGVEPQLLRMVQQRAPEPLTTEPEDPVLLLILVEGGLTLFSHSFAAGQQLDEHLIGGFLTALAAFGQDALVESGAIDRITYQNYTVAVKSLETLLICYIFQGPSYLALQKLDHFISRLQDIPVIQQSLTAISRPDAMSKAVGALDAPVQQGLTQLLLEIFPSAPS